MKLAKIIGLTCAAVIITACGKESSTQCTDADKSQWMDAEVFKQSISDKGYQIKEFVETSGNCYEIYGLDSKGQKVEIYFNPVDGSAVKTEMH